MSASTLDSRYCRLAPAAPAGTRPSLRREIAEGLRWLWTSRPLRAVVGVGVILAVAAAGTALRGTVTAGGQDA